MVRLRRGHVHRHLAAQPLSSRRALIALLCIAWLGGCGTSPAPSPPRDPGVGRVDPASIVTVGSALPAGYEVAALDGPISAAALIGFGPGWAADPPPCAALADPAPAAPGARGLSASGPGGTVFVAAAPVPAPPDPGLIAGCPTWTMTFVHTSATVTQSPPPVIEGAQTLAWRAPATTVVEAGSRTDSNATAAFAFLDGHVAFAVLVTDPGSAEPPLDDRVVAELLADTVAALRGSAAAGE